MELVVVLIHIAVLQNINRTGGKGDRRYNAVDTAHGNHPFILVAGRIGCHDGVTAVITECYGLFRACRKHQFSAVYADGTILIHRNGNTCRLSAAAQLS